MRRVPRRFHASLFRAGVAAGTISFVRVGAVFGMERDRKAPDRRSALGKWP